MVVCLQETKLSLINNATIKSLWKIKDVGWLHLSAMGSVRVIVIMWNKDSIDCIDSCVGKTTISYKFVNRVQRLEWYFTGVYCCGNRDERIALWKELADCQDKWSNVGVVGSNNQFSASISKEFNDNLELLNLTDLSLMGGS